jgi:hypothetical protein
VNIVLWIAGAVASAFIGLVFTVLFQDRLSIILVNVLRGVWVGDRRRSISGDWFTYYAVVPDRATSSSAAEPSGSIEVIRLSQVGNRVAGVNTSRSRDYQILAVLRDDSYLTGTWRDFSEGRYHWGGFQLWWLDNGRGLVGKFVGKDSRNHINHGIWLWARKKDDLYRLADWTCSKGGYAFDISDFKSGLDAALAQGGGP